MERITSRQNPVVAEYRAASRGDTRGTILLDGPHLLGDALGADVRLRHVLVASEALDRPEIRQLLAHLPATVPVFEGSRQVLDAVSPVRSSSAIVALAAQPPEPADLFSGAMPLVVLLSDVQDPGNVGAIIRVAEGAGASGAIVAGQSADPFGWKALRGSMGSALRLPVQRVTHAADALHDARLRGVRTVATVPRHGVSLYEADLTGPLALLVGGEGPGLSEALTADADLRVTIPMNAPVESLNAAVATAVLLYEVRRQRTAAGRTPLHA